MTGIGPNGDRSPASGIRVQLPTAALFWTVAVTCLMVAGLWSTAIALGPWGTAEFTTGLIGIGVMFLLAMAGVLILSPWKMRPIADWMTLWLAATVFRLLVTPVAAYLIYSTVSLPARPLGLSVALTYVATLFVEAAIIARHMNAICDQQSAISRSSHRSD